MDEIKNIGAFAEQLNKRQSKEFFEEGGLGKNAVKKQCNGDTEKIIIGDNTYRGLQTCGPGLDNRLQRHNQYANKHQRKTGVGKVNFTGAGKAVFQYVACQLHACKKLETPAKKGVKHYKGEVAEKAVEVYMPKNEHHGNGKERDNYRLDIKLMIFFGDEENNRRRKVKALFHG